MFRQGLYAALAILLALVAGCGSHGSPAGSEPAGPANQLSAAIESCRTSSVPEGVDTDTWRMLADELARVLEERRDGTLRAANMLEVPSDVVQSAGTLYWSQNLPGDYDNNGVVNISDLSPLGVHLGEAVPSSQAGGGPMLRIDGNRDGEISIYDVTPIGVHFGESITGYAVIRAEDSLGSNAEEYLHVKPPAHSEGAQAFTTVYSYRPDKTGYYAISPRGIGQSLGLRSSYFHVSTEAPDPQPGTDPNIDPDPGPDPDPNPNPDPDPDPDPDHDPDPDPDRPQVDLDAEAAPAIGYGIVTGKVTDTSGSLLAGTRIAIPMYGVVTTNETGHFIARDVPTSANHSVIVELDGYASTTRNIRVDKDEETYVEFSLSAIASDKTIPASQGGYLGSRGAYIDIAPNSIVDAVGNLVNDTVELALTPVDVSNLSERSTTPGDFEAVLQDGSQALLESYGMMEVSIKDSLGNDCYVSGDSEVEMQMLIPADMRENAPSKIGLYVFNEINGEWEEVALIGKSTDGRFYSGEIRAELIRNIRWLNCDDPIYLSAIKVNIVDEKDRPVINLAVRAVPIGSQATAFQSYTDEKGEALLFSLTSWSTEIYYQSFDDSQKVGTIMTSDQEYDPDDPSSINIYPETIVVPINMAFTLQWEPPCNLDFHFITPSEHFSYVTGGDELVVNMAACGVLEEGPERFVLKKLEDGEYNLFAYNKSEGVSYKNLAESKAAFTISGNTIPSYDVFIPEDMFICARTWHAARIIVSNNGSDIEVIPVNQFLDEPPFEVD